MSPFRSKAQMRYLFAKKPEIAKRWAAEYPRQRIQDLPLHVKKKSSIKRKRRR